MKGLTSTLSMTCYHGTLLVAIMERSFVITFSLSKVWQIRICIDCHYISELQPWKNFFIIDVTLDIWWSESLLSVVFDINCFWIPVSLGDKHDEVKK
jgi:hypothetical protein